MTQEQETSTSRHNKEEYPPMHTAEHLLNQTMTRMFGCERSRNAHIERRKSKMSFTLPECPTETQIAAIVAKMNELIRMNLQVTYETVKISEVPESISIERLPKDVTQSIRIVRIGNYDACACIGKHVASTIELQSFILLGTNWDEEKGSFRIRFKLGTV